MANVVDKAFSATYGGANLNEIFYEPTFRSDEILANYRVIPNVKHKMNVFAAAPLTKIVNAYTGCSSALTGGDFDLSDKTIEAGRCRVALEQCADEFFGTYIEELYRSGVDATNVEGTEIGDMMVKRTVDGIGQDVVRLAWGGDTTAATAYAPLNGWMKLMAAETVIEEVGTVGSVSGTDAINLLRAVFDGAPAALQQIAVAEKKMFVTPRLFNAYLANLEGTSSDLAYASQKDGVMKVSFRGVELVPMYEWDTILTDTNPALFTDAAAAECNDGVCYIATQNLLIGTDVADPQSQLKMWYEDKDEKVLVRSYFKLGVQYLFSSLTQWGIVASA
tara:strand:+ start:1548 stop:2549 length:1002 start_codon:yes stop_codon:yes gene_type:complete